MFWPKKAIREVLMDHYEQLSEWILKELEGTLSPKEFHAMERLLSSDSDALDFYINSYFSISYFMEPFQMPQDVTDVDKGRNAIDSELWKELAEIERNAETVEVAPPREVPVYPIYQVTPAQVRHPVSRMSITSILISMAALIMLLVYVFLNPRTSVPVVGMMVDTVGAKWQDETAAMQPGQELQKGPLYLRQGLARIRFDSGASVILEGPAQVDLLSGNSLYVHEGKIVATVGREAIGFVVNTPEGKILDLGTEFGIRVESAGRSQVHVFQGEVFLYPGNQGGHMKISAGNASSIDKNGQVRDIPVQRAAFIRQEELDSKIMARSNNTYYRWKSFIFEAHRDPSLVAHYFCTKDDAQPDSLLNAAPLMQGQLTGRFGVEGRAAPTWVAGRWPEKSAVRFERGKNQAIVIPSSPTLSINGPITISAWVYYPDEIQNGGHLISCREDYHVNFQFAIFDRNYVYSDQRYRFEFLRFNPKRTNQEYIGAYSQEFIQRAGVWYYFVVTHDMENICFYVNGRLFENKPYASYSDAKGTEIVIGGQKLNGRYALPEGDFDGVVDELMIFKRCLNSDEIQKMYEAGLPVSGTSR
jgi:hypothetical protein